jgi:putative transposase
MERIAMKKSRFTEEQVTFALHGLRSLGRWPHWKKKYGELGASEVRRLRQLEDENARLKRLVVVLVIPPQVN